MYVKDHHQLASLATEAGFSARRLAQMIGWRSHSHMCRILSGQTKTVAADSATELARVLGVTVSEIFLSEVSSES